MPEEMLWIITNDVPEASTADAGKGWGEEARKLLTTPIRVEVSAATVEQEITKLLRLVGRSLQQAATEISAASELQLDEVELSVTVNSKGQVSLWSVGGEVGSQGAIKLKFKAKPPLMPPASGN